MDNIVARKRKELNISQYELARRTGITRSQIGNIEVGANKVGYEKARRLAEVLGVTWYEIFEDLHSQKKEDK